MTEQVLAILFLAASYIFGVPVLHKIISEDAFKSYGELFIGSHIITILMLIMFAVLLLFVYGITWAIGVLL